MPNVSEFVEAKDTKVCDGCACLIYPGHNYVHSRFTLNDPGTNVVRFISVYICGECLFDFDDFAYGANNDVGC